MKILIAGAGLIGGAIAWRLAQAGAQVTLADAGGFGGKTSSAGAGMLAPGGEFDKPSVWLELGVEGMRLYPSFVEELSAESGVAIDFVRCGCMHFADAEQARVRGAFQSSRGIRVEVRPNGLFYPDDGFIDPGDLLRALKCACQRRGVELLENHRLAQIEAAEHDTVVIAAGAWSSQIRVTRGGVKVELPAVKPVKGHLIGFELAPGTLGPMLRRGHTYVLQRSNGFTLAGSNEEDAGFDSGVDPAMCAEIHRQASRLFPALEGLQASKCWTGLRPYCSEPHIRRAGGTNVWLAYGHFRNGILLAPLTAARISEEIFGAG